MGYCTIMIAAFSLLGLTALTTTNQAFAWGFWHEWGDQGWNGVGSCCGDGGGGLCCNQGDQGLSQGTDAYNAGIADAVYDHQNNLSYHPLANCLPCHSQEYWNNFREGYQHQWNTYQSSQQTTNNYVTVNGNGNEVNINQKQDSSQVGGGSLNFGGQPQLEGCCGWNNGPGPGDP